MLNRIRWQLDRIKFFVIFVLSILFLHPTTTSAQTNQYLAYDGFSYTQGTTLHSQYGGTGWLAPWEIQNNNTTIPGYGNDNSLPMSFSNLLNQGGYVKGGLAYLSIGRKLDLSTNGPFSDYKTPGGKLGKVGKTIYFSVLLRKENSNNDPVTCMLQGGNNVPWVPSANPRVMLGFFGSSSVVSGTGYWGIQLNNTNYLTSKQVIPGETVLLVCRIDFLSSGCAVKCWVNPTDIGNSEPLNADLDFNSTDVLEFLSIASTLGNSPGQASMDEIRIGANYATVTPTALTPLNSPPIASVTVNPSGGIAPVIIDFDGSASMDPESQLLTQYIWNYGDGNTDTLNSLLTSHEYTDLGIFTATLKIADTQGLSHTAYSTFSITDANGNYPCQAYVECIQHATCGEDNGSLKVFASGATFELYNSQNALISTCDANSIYDSLTTDTYVLHVQSPLGCRDTLHLFIQTDSTTCPDYVIPECINFGINLDGTSYYDRQRVYKNLFNDASEWLTFHASGSSPWNTNVAQEIPKDPAGYPLELPCNTSLGPQKMRASISALGHILPGHYILKYDGEGMLNIGGGVTVTYSIPGRIEFSVNQNYYDNIWIDIHSSILNNHIRNIRILRPQHDNDDLTQPFYEEFLNKIEPFSTIRFMDVMATNSNYNPSDWVLRKDESYYSQSIRSGMAYENIVKMGNISGKNIWINIPHTANEDYVREMARFFRDNLTCELNIYLEYSNEVWNWMFPQAYAVADQEPQNISYARRYAERCRWAFGIWMEEFSGQTARLYRVLNTQAFNPWYGEQILAHLDQSEYDYLSPAWYFSYGGACMNAFNASTTVSQIIDCSREYFLATLPTIRKDYLNAAMYGKKIINYEGGQHMTDFSMTPYTPTVWQAQLDPQMYDVYNQVIDSLKKMGTDLAIAYNLARTNETIWGSFGHLSDIDMVPTITNAPKYMALIDNTCPYTAPQTDFSLQVIEACNSYDWINGITYFSDTANVYYTLQNNRGCDSVIELNLSIQPLTVEITEESGILTAVCSAFDSIQWVQCLPEFGELSGETQLTFSPVQNGTYGALIYLNDCSLISECLTVSISGLDEKHEPKLRIVPNPTFNNCFKVIGNTTLELSIIDSQSKEVWSGFINDEQHICLESVQSGIYFIRVANRTYKFVLM